MSVVNLTALAEARAKMRSRHYETDEWYAGLAATDDAADALIEIARAALEWQTSPQVKSRDARKRLLAALAKVTMVRDEMRVAIGAVDLHVGTTVTVEIPAEEVADVIGALRSRATMYRADRAHDAIGIAALHASADRLDAIADQLEPRS